MGAHPYWYVVKYKPDINEALQALRQREFQAGRYNPVIRYLDFPIGPHSPAPGAQHATMDEALRASDADGTRSIIDLKRISEEPDHGTASPLGEEVLQELFGTTRPTRETVEARPTREMVKANKMLWSYEARGRRILGRGRGIYIVLYKDDSPDEIYFAGYSSD